MRCFCCDTILDNPPLDKPTGRYYCGTCMEPTNEVILKMLDKEYTLDNRKEEEFISLDELLEIENAEEEDRFERLDTY